MLQQSETEEISAHCRIIFIAPVRPCRRILRPAHLFSLSHQPTPSASRPPRSRGVRHGTNLSLSLSVDAGPLRLLRRGRVGDCGTSPPGHLHCAQGARFLSRHGSASFCSPPGVRSAGNFWEDARCDTPSPLLDHRIPPLLLFLFFSCSCILRCPPSFPLD
jgi:hypothetical protein